MADTAQFVDSDILKGMPRVRHAFFTSRGGVSSGIYESLNAGLGSDDDRASVVENRRRMADVLNVDAGNIASPYQVHSADVVFTDKAWDENRPKADGVVTKVPGLALGIVTADCGPVLFCDGDAGVIGACHAGWKGAVGGVMEATIDCMVEHGATRKNITAVLGPTISHANYEVGPDFPKPFLELDAGNSRYFSASVKADHHMFDLPAYIVDRLNKAGVRGSSVNLCTYQGDSQFFSYRRTTHRGEADYGRQMSAIVLE